VNAPTSSSRPAVVIIIDSVTWYGFLGLLVTVSFLDHQFASGSWLLVVSGLCGLLALHSISVAFHGRCNVAALVSAKVNCLLIFAILILLCLQLFVPYSTALHQDFVQDPQNASALLWFAPQTAWSVVPVRTQWLLLSEIAMFLAYLSTLCLVSTRFRLKQVLIVILCVGLVHAVVGSFTKFAGLSLVDLQELDGHFSAARGWFINRNHFASFISLTSVGALVYFLKSFVSAQQSNYKTILLSHLIGHRALLVAALVSSFVAIILSQSRAGFLGFLLVCLLPFVLFRTRTSGPSFTFWITFLVPMGLVIAGALWYFGGDLLARFSGDSISLGERVSQWHITLRAIQKEWLLGYGGGSYATVFQVERGYEDLRQVVFDQSHNDYLHIWLERGLLGLILWIGLIVLTLQHGYKVLLSSTSSLVVASMIAIIMVTIAVLLQAAVDFNIQIPNIRFYFFVIIALVYAIPTIRQSKRKTSRYLKV